MDTEKTLEMLKQVYGNRISWYMESPFYADSDGKLCQSGVIIFCTDTDFHCYGNGVDTVFAAIDVLTVEHAKKDSVIDFINGKSSKLRYLGSLPAMFTDSLDVIELDGKKQIFLKIKGTEFKQMLKIASCKQKYSMEEYNRTKAHS